MIGEGVAALRQSAPKQDIFDAAAIASRDEYGTLILDGLGKILGCGEPAERMFGTSHDQLVGRWISEFIAGLFLDGSSPSYRVRYLAYLCASGEWRRFNAEDADGRGFTVELNVERRVTEGRDIFVLNTRRTHNGEDS